MKGIQKISAQSSHAKKAAVCGLVQEKALFVVFKLH